MQIILHPFSCWEPRAVQYGTGPPVRAQPTLQMPSLEKLHHFAHFSRYPYFLQWKQLYVSFLLPNKSMFTWELITAALDKGKATQLVSSAGRSCPWLLSGLGRLSSPCRQAPELSSPAQPSPGLLLLFTLLCHHILSLLHLISNIFLFYRT